MYRDVFRLSGIVVALLVIAMPPATGAQSFAFTYQGMLKQNSLPANGVYDFRFGVYDAPSGGTLLEVTPLLDDVSVMNGLFTVDIQLPVSAFSGADRWLEIAVRPGASSGAFTILSPRVRIGRIPYALHSLSANAATPIGNAGGDLGGTYPNPMVSRLQGRSVSSSAPGVDQVLKWTGSAWSPANDETIWLRNGSHVFFEGGMVGIGTSTPNRALTLRGNPVGGASQLVQFRDSNNVDRWHLNIVEGGLNFAQSGVADFRLFLDNSGRVGVGTDSPTAQLHVLAPAAGGTAITGANRSTSGTGIGVLGSTGSSQLGSIGVAGSHPFNQDSAAVYAFGRLKATGTKEFQSDYPLDPENAVLSHFCTEGPEPYNAYSGNVVTDAQGYAVVALPEYFESINRDFRYQLTVLDGSDDFVLVKVVRKIENNRFVIRTSKPRVEVSWRVEAVRHDRWIQRYGYRTVTPKEGSTRGKYLNPELYGAPPELGIFHPILEEPQPATPR